MGARNKKLKWRLDYKHGNLEFTTFHCNIKDLHYWIDRLIEVGIYTYQLTYIKQF